MDTLRSAFDIVIEGAKKHDHNEFQNACQLYIEAATIFLEYSRSDIFEKCRQILRKLAGFCVDNAEKLKNVNGTTRFSIQPQQTKITNTNVKVVLQDIRIYALEKAITSDETQRYEDAYNWYMEASQRSLQLLQYERDNKVFGKQAREAIERATQLKKHVQQKAPVAPTPPPSLTQREIAVLKSTSTINGKLYYPWDDSDGIITNTELYVDPKGMLELSQEQKNHFSCWKRPSEFVPQGTDPVMINIISAYSITQSVVTDCSFVASLSVAAAYERKHNKKLISHCVYPQDSDGKPIYNPNGKYAVKLHMNGVARVVVIDDYLPVSSDDRLLCSYSTNRSELWVSLVEKAYMKLNGGYNFPGSNSGIDMHALTGWIPEEIVLGKEDRNIWNRLVDGHEMGNCVMTISTTQLSTQLENSLGLHSSHAYAILDVRTLKDGTRLLQLKNPWTRRRWKGKFSPDDQTNWTQDRLKEVNYDLLGALQYDNGVFWLDFESAVKNFAVIHLSWNPNLFIYKSIVHERWEERDRPISGSDHYNMNYNPQYWLTVSGTGSVWIMLTKHVTSIQTRNDDFVTCHIYGGTNGYYGNTNTQPIVPNHRIFYNEKPIIKGRYSNDPHYRAVMEVKGPSVFKLVISQYKEIKNICYTLKVYGTIPCELKEIPRKYQFSVSSNGQWDHFTGGGNSSLPTYRSNPQYRLDFASGGMTNLRFMLDTPTPDLYVNVSVFRNNGEKIQLATTDKVVGTSGNYRNCCACLDIDNFVINSPLTVVVSTFSANQDGSFFLTVESSNTGIKMVQLS